VEALTSCNIALTLERGLLFVNGQLRDNYEAAIVRVRSGLVLVPLEQDCLHSRCMKSRCLRLEEPECLGEVTSQDLSTKEANLVDLGQPGAKNLDRHCLSWYSRSLSADILREGSAKGSRLGPNRLIDFIELTFLIGFQMSSGVCNVLFSLAMNCYDCVQEVGGNFVKATFDDVLVNDDEVCGFGVVRDLPLALQTVNQF